MRSSTAFWFRWWRLWWINATTCWTWRPICLPFPARLPRPLSSMTSKRIARERNGRLSWRNRSENFRVPVATVFWFHVHVHLPGSFHFASRILLFSEHFQITVFNFVLFYLQVIPSQKQYVANFFDELRVAMNTELGESHEEMMMDSHRRNREHGESKLKFQVCARDETCFALARKQAKTGGS